MFEQLKKKISGLIKSFASEEEKAAEAVPQAQETQLAGTVKEKLEVKGEKPQTAEMVNLSLKTKIKGVFSRSVTLSDSDIGNFLENLKVLMLESDVSYNTTEAFLNNLEKELRSSKFESKQIKEELAKYVRNAILNVLNSTKPGIDIFEFVQAHKNDSSPIKILFLGPNGTGKTTTIAKIAYGLKLRGIGSVFSASDTFRAAAIEQTEHHAKKVGATIIKSRYGADPASVAFDAIAYAKAHRINVVLIDTAGRQETNKNLVNEMTKIARIAQPDITVFVGESTAGNAIAEQIKEFSKFIKIDGIILTKLDCDAKGGNALSIANITGIPVLFFGTGESYESLIPYDPNFIINAILPNN